MRHLDRGWNPNPRRNNLRQRGQRAYDTQASGAGAGGTVRLTVGHLAGAGAVTANGGYGLGCSNGTSGGGGGGRVAVLATTATFTGAMSAIGDVGGIRAGAGTVFTKFGTQPYGRLIVANSNLAGEATPSLSPDIFDEVVVGTYARLVLNGETALMPYLLRVANGGRVEIVAMVDCGAVLVEAGGVIAPIANDLSFHLRATNDIEIESGGAIDATALGYPSGNGPGAGGEAVYYAAGGGYGGRGADSGTGAPGGETYGSRYSPLEMGSGGGAHTTFAQPGGAGGGIIRITAGGALLVDGAIRANGGNGQQAYDTCASGGGAGGSVYLQIGQLSGNGTISADGGSAPLQAGGGGGGRISIRTCEPFQLPSSNITASGGNGYFDGEPGTFFVGSPFIEMNRPPTDQHHRLGETAVFTLDATTTSGTLHYRWRKDGVELTDDGRITGAASATLTIRNVNAGDYNLYDVLMTDDCDSFLTDPVILTKPGDLDGDADVDLADLAALLSNYGWS